MINDLTTEQRAQIEEALKSAFNLAYFEQMLMLQLGLKLEEEVGIREVGFSVIVTRTVDLALMGGWLDKLLLGASKYRSGNLKLNNVIQQFGLDIPKIIPSNKPQPVSINAIPTERALEKIINERTAFQRFNDFTQRLRTIGYQICRVEFPEGVAQGTGFMVGPNLLLTAYHVIKGIHEQSNGFSPEDIVCRFDYTNDGLADEQRVGRVCHLANHWIIDHSPYALSDEGKAQEEPTNDELDYALLVLEESVGEEIMPDGSKRGWIHVQENPTVMVQSNDIMLIPQHPNGRPLELAFGGVLNYNSKANRLRYNTNTESGSSGSPCFDVSLTPFGLHHAGGPTDSLEYNQCVPLRQIVKRMKKNSNVPIFWINNNK